MRQFIIEVTLSKRGVAWYEMEYVLCEAKSVHSAKRIARRVAENKRKGWRVRAIDKSDGSMYQNVKFINALPKQPKQPRDPRPPRNP